MDFPRKLQDRLQLRSDSDSLRQLPFASLQTDFSSNDYLGFAASSELYRAASEIVEKQGCLVNGATGSRLISGNHPLYKTAEQLICDFHQTDAALIFNSGYDANVGFFSALPQKGDIILYDELCHASIRDGIRLSNAKAIKFRHNDYEHLMELLERYRDEFPESVIYVATESVFSMDGDSPLPELLVQATSSVSALLVVDEAHALGVIGGKGEGLFQQYAAEGKVFARIVTFGKALGCHGAAVLGSTPLKDYLVNFARSFIYTTALPPHSVATIIAAYTQLQADQTSLHRLRDNIVLFNQQKNMLQLKPLFVRSKSAIQSAVIPGNETVRGVAAKIRDSGFDVKAILSPTVPEGQERLRICIHSFNTEDEIIRLLVHINTWVGGYGR